MDLLSALSKVPHGKMEGVKSGVKLKPIGRNLESKKMSQEKNGISRISVNCLCNFAIVPCCLTF